MIIPFKSLWTNQNLTGTLNWLLGSLSLSTKNSWNQKGINSLKQVTPAPFFTMVLTSWRALLQNLLSKWPRMKTTGIKTRSTSQMWNWNSTMDKTKVNWPNHSVKMLLAWQNSSQLDLVTQSKPKNLKMKSPTLLKTPLLMLLVPTSTVNLTNTLLRRPMKKNNLLRKLSWTRTSVKRSALPSTVKLMLLNWTEKTEQARSSVTSTFHQHLSKLMARPSVKWWKHNWIPMEMSGNLLN